MNQTLDQHQPAYTPDFPYYAENRLTHQAYGEDIVQAIRKTGARSVLSLGVGHSEVAQRILSELTHGALEHYCIVEGSPRILADFRTAHEPLPSGLELVEGFFETFEHPGRFDLIEAGFVLEHVDDPARVLRRMQGLLSDQGRMLIAVPNARSLHRLLGHLAGFLPDLYALSDADHALGHQRYFTASDWSVSSWTAVTVYSGRGGYCSNR